MKKKSRFVHVNGSTIIHCPVSRGFVLKTETLKASEKEGTLDARCLHCYEAVAIKFVENPKGKMDIKVDRI